MCDAGRKNRRALVKKPDFLVAFIDQSTEHKRTALITSLITRNSEIVVDATGDVGHRAQSKKELVA